MKNPSGPIRAATSRLWGWTVKGIVALFVVALAIGFPGYAIWNYFAARPLEASGLALVTGTYAGLEVDRHAARRGKMGFTDYFIRLSGRSQRFRLVTTGHDTPEFNRTEFERDMRGRTATLRLLVDPGELAGGYFPARPGEVSVYRAAEGGREYLRFTDTKALHDSDPLALLGIASLIILFDVLWVVASFRERRGKSPSASSR